MYGGEEQILQRWNTHIGVWVARQGRASTVQQKSEYCQSRFVYSKTPPSIWNIPPSIKKDNGSAALKAKIHRQRTHLEDEVRDKILY